MKSFFKIIFLLLVTGLFLGLTVNPPKGLKRQTDQGRRVVVPTSQPGLIPQKTPSPQPVISPAESSPAPKVTRVKRSKEVAVPRQRVIYLSWPLLKKILLILGGVLLLIWLGIFIYKKSLPEF